VIMLFWHNVWMAKHGREMAQEMRAIGRAVTLGEKSLFAMAVVVAIAVLREGSEVVLFLYGIAASTQEGTATLLLGGALGVGAGCLLAYLLYRGLLAIPLRRLFSVTGWLITLLAAGMAGQAAAILASVELIPSWGVPVWDTSWLLHDDSLLGRALHALVGYSDQPVGVQLVAYAAVVVAFVVCGRLVRQSVPRSPAPTRAVSQH
jgi:high-affinity iron transporter